MNSLAVGAAALVLPVVLFVGAATQTSVVVVEVTMDDGPRIVAPVPLVLARAGLALAPREAREIHAPELAAHLPHIRRIVDALRDAPDGDLVEIETRDEHVLVSKRGDAVHVSVVDVDRTRVELTVPLAAAASLPRAYDVESGTLHTGALLKGLRRAPRGPLLHLVDGGTEVRLRAW